HDLRLHGGGRLRQGDQAGGKHAPAGLPRDADLPRQGGTLGGDPEQRRGREARRAQGPGDGGGAGGEVARPQDVLSTRAGAGAGGSRAGMVAPGTSAHAPAVASSFWATAA